MKTVSLKFALVSAALLLLLIGGATRSSLGQTPEGWRRVEAEGKLTFDLPPLMKQSRVRGIDNIYQEYKQDAFSLHLVYEPLGVLAYENREEQYGKDYREIETLVDGRKALLFIYRREAAEGQPPTYRADLYVGDLPNAQVKLWMWAISTNPDDIETARRIFSSVKFTEAEGSAR
jgi:hypothetical protein